MATLDADDLQAISDLLDARIGALIGTPVSLSGGAATLAAMLVKMADNGDGVDFHSSTGSLHKLAAALAGSSRPALLPHLLGAHTLTNGTFTVTWSGDDFHDGETLTVYLANLNADGTNVDQGGQQPVGALAVAGGLAGQPSWTDQTPGGDGYADFDCFHVMRASTSGALASGWATLALADGAQFGGWTKRFFFGAYGDGDTNSVLTARGDHLHPGASGLKVCRPAADTSFPSVLLPVMPAASYSTVSSAYEVEIVRGDGPLSLPVNLGTDCTGYDAWFAGKKSPYDTTYSQAPRLCTWVDQAAGTLTVPLTTQDTSEAGRYRVEVEIRAGAVASTMRIFTLRVTAGVMG